MGKELTGRAGTARETDAGEGLDNQVHRARIEAARDIEIIEVL